MRTEKCRGKKVARYLLEIIARSKANRRNKGIKNVTVHVVNQILISL